MPDSITILIVDDHTAVRKGIRSYLDTQPDFCVVGEAGSGEEAVEILSRLIPDMVLLDIFMPGMNGIEATSQIRKISPRTKVVILTSAPGGEYRLPALKAGAISYLLKDMKMEQLANAVRRAAQEGASFHSHTNE